MSGSRRLLPRNHRLDFTRQTVKNLQLAYDIARRNLRERTDEQAGSNDNLSVPEFHQGDRMLTLSLFGNRWSKSQVCQSLAWSMYCRSQLSPVVYCVGKYSEATKVSVHLARMKSFHARSSNSALESSDLTDLFLGMKLPVPDFEARCSR